jgi:ABC-type polysaccharide/polyol phosphate transport system ATPase subunit
MSIAAGTGTVLPRIELRNVVLDYPVYEIDSRSLRHTMLSATTGGRLRSDEQRVTVIRALDGLDLSIGPGERIGLYGHNGAGKTTLLRVMAGIFQPTGGTVRVEGRISPMFDPMVGINSEFTGYDNIALRCMLLGLSDEQIGLLTPRIAEFSELGDYLHLPVRTYSTGMCSRLAFSIATSIEPEILLLDEWLGVADKAFLEKAKRRMHDFIARSSILVLASHSVPLLRDVCTKVITIEHGRIIAVEELTAAA